MGRWIAALKKRENAAGANRQNPQNPTNEGFVGFGGALPDHIGEIFSRTFGPVPVTLPEHAGRVISPADYDLWVEFEERAAILEYDAGLPRAEAEQRAKIQVYGADRLPDTWPELPD